MRKKLKYALFYANTNYVTKLFVSFKKDDKLANGYIITLSGERKNVKFILEDKPALVREGSDIDISDYKMQHSPRYINEKGKRRKLIKTILGSMVLIT